MAHLFFSHNLPISPILKLLFVFTSFLLFSIPLSSQVDSLVHNQIYKPITWKNDGALGIASTVIAGATIYTHIANDRKTISKEEVDLLDRNDVLGIDRPATYRWSLDAQKWSDYLQYGAIALPVILNLDKDYRKQFGKISFYTLESLILTVGTTHIIKNTYGRPRPFTYNENVPDGRKLRNRNNQSFPSGHTAFVANFSFLCAKTYSDTNPNLSTKAKIALWSSAIILPSLTGTFRITGGKHFLSDVVVGGIIGAASGFLIPHVHRSDHPRHSLGMSDMGVTYSYTLDYR